MNLSMSLIAHYLEKYEPELHIVEDKQTIRGVRFFTDQLEHYSLDYVYLGQAGGYFRDVKFSDALLLANGQNQIICRGADYEALLNDVLGAFEFYNQFEQQLFLAAQEHKPLSAMMKITETVLRRSVLVFDLDGKLVGAANPEDLEEEALRNSILMSENLGLASIGQVLVDKNGEIHHDLTDYPQYLRVVDQKPAENVCKNVMTSDSDFPAGELKVANQKDSGGVSMYLFQEKERIGFIMIFVKSKPDISVSLCLEPLLAKACSGALEFTEPSSLRQSNHSIMSQLLMQENLTPAVLEKFEESLQFTGDAVMILFDSMIIRNYTFRRIFMTELEQSRIPCICTEYEDHVAVLTDETHLDSALTLIQRKLPPQNIAIGVSMPIRQLDLLYVACRQCLFALGNAGKSGVYYCKDLALPYLLRNLRENPMSENLLHPVVSLLQRYDTANETELLNTLSMYLNCQCSQSVTADRLHVHLNTLKYRIRRIRELSGIDFHNEEEVFYIQLSLKLVEKKGT